MTDIFVRAFTDNKPESKPKDPENHNQNIRLIFDTETSIDQYQNLTFGSCLIQTEISTGIKEEWYLFYGDIPQDKLSIIEKYGKKHNITVMPIKDFVNEIFYPYAYKMRCEIIGFNLPFDLSRLAISFGISRKTEDGFSFNLSEDTRNPRIRIQSIDQKRAFISFTKPLRKKSDKKRPHYSGFFVDLKTLTFALTDKSHSLDSACKDFNVSRKQHTEEHGKITEQYIDYNINDVRITTDLYEAALERYKMFNLEDPVNKLYSPASIGKAYLRKMGIKSFNEQNPDFSKDVMGFVMSSYYGGRTEVMIRNKPVRVSYLDFTSMYPSVYSLLKLDDYLKSDKITFYENTKRVGKFVSSLKIEDLQNPEIWLKPEIHSIVSVRPNDDILPVRMQYGKEAKIIGINYLTTDKNLWYTVQDVIASKLLSGKSPDIIQAFTFLPNGKQNALTDVSISDITISPDDDFIKKVIEERIKIKKSNRSDKNQVQLILKIIANATSYGIYIEENSETIADSRELDVYSVEHFAFKSNKIEKQGFYFNPIMASLITGSSRLILAIAESIAVSEGYFAYCDTDSVFVDPEVVKSIQDFFKHLNPYSVKVEMFKIEEDDNEESLDNVMFYGISAKRYCLYDNTDDKITIRKYSTHGLGHIKGIDGAEIWKDILNKKFENYSNKLAVSQITITKPSILKRFRKMNSGKPMDRQVKPFNFMLIGSEKNDVIPCLPYSKDIAGIEYRSFTDYNTGIGSNELPLPSTAYWHTLEDVLIQYIRHSDDKFDYIDGIAERKHIVMDKVRYIGKESNNLDEVNTFGVQNDSVIEYSDNSEFYPWVLKLKPNKITALGISERGLRNFKRKIRNGNELKNRSKIARIIFEYYLKSDKPD